MQVKYPNGTEAHDLNELEYVNGTIFANVFMTMEIVNIDLEEGTVVEEWTMPEEMKEQSTRHLDYFDQYHAVLNGIAYHQRKTISTSQESGGPMFTK